MYFDLLLSYRLTFLTYVGILCKHVVRKYSCFFQYDTKKTLCL